MKITALFTCMLMSLMAVAQDYRIENNEVVITKQINFKTGTAELLPESDDALRVIKKYLDDKTYISMLRVEAHTDNNGSTTANQQLSEKRAAAVCQRLISMGVDCNRLVPVGFGGSKPVAENATPEGRSQNRRITFVNAQLRGKNIGGMPVDGGGKIAENPCY